MVCLLNQGYDGIVKIGKVFKVIKFNHQPNTTPMFSTSP